MRTRRGVCEVLGLAAAILSGGCGDAFVNATASLGGAVAGARGSIDVIVINNTSHNAGFVLGTFDPNDPSFMPDATQFGLDDVGLTLGPDARSDAISFQCARVLSAGGQRLRDLIESSFDPSTIEQVSFVEGVAFFDVAPDVANATPVFLGSAPALEALLGLDFNCGSILLLRLEDDELNPGVFRIDFEVIPSESGR